MLWLMLWILVFTTVGVLAYSGVWKSWVRSTQMFAATAPFAALFHGVGMAMMVSAPLLTRGSLGFQALFWIGGALNAVAVLGLFWLPTALLPTWWKVLAQKERETPQ